MLYKGYKISDSIGSGKAVKGKKKTATIQVKEIIADGYLLRKEFRYSVASFYSNQAAIEKAKKFVDELTGGV